MAPELGSIDALIGPAPEDFVVDEIPLYAQSGVGEHVYARIEKRGYTTPAMVRAVTRAAGVDERDVGYAGLKDKHAVTRQWLSLPNKSRRQTSGSCPMASASSSTRATATSCAPGICWAIASASRSSPGFGCAGKGGSHRRALEAARRVQLLRGQRFGRAGDGLRQALTWLREGGKMHGLPRFLTKLYPSVIQAEVFNRYFSARRALGLDRLLLGEVVRLDQAGAMFAVEDTEREGPRLTSGDIHLTGPMFGPKARATSRMQRRSSYR